MADHKDLGFEEAHDDLGFIPEDSMPIEEQPSDLADLGRAVASGATLGGSDELLAALQAAKEVAVTDKTIKDLPSLYREYQRLEQEKLRQAKERSPYLTTAGEIAGSIPTIAATGGSAAGLLGGLAVQGALSSESTVEQPQEIAKDVAGNVALGGALMGAGKAVGSIASRAGEVLAPKYEKLKYLFELGKEGKSLSSPAVQKELSGLEKSEAEAITKDIFSKRKELGSQIGSKLEQATEEGVKLQNPIADAAFELQDIYEKNPAISGNKRFRFLLDQASKNELTPQEAQSLKGETQMLIDKLEKDPSMKASEASESLSNLKKAIIGQFEENVPGYKDLTGKFAKFNQMTAETPGLLDKQVSVTRDAEEKLASKLEGVIKGSKTGAYADRDKLETLKKLQENIKALKESNPEAVSSAIESIPKRIEETGTKSAAIKEFYGEGAPKTVTEYATNFAPGTVANQLGLASKSLGHAVSSYTPEQLMQLVDKLKNIPGAQANAEALAKAVAEKNNAAKNAAIFTLLQRPGTRQVIESHNE